MKKYFTKYLPVEGEIKLGDSFTDGDIIMTCDKPSLLVPSDKKVKLFLCSRDIQVGDEFWEGTNKIDQKYSDTDYIDTEAYPEFDRFKVIGEVSPEADWVTVAMEFDEKDFAKVITSIRGGVFTSGGEAFIKQFPDEYFITCKFRCPSSPNHFH